jgi:DNA polymerase I
LKLKIVDATYRYRNGSPVVVLVCKTLNGEQKIIEVPYLPYFYVRDYDPNYCFNSNKVSPPDSFLKSELSDFKPYDSDSNLYKIYVKRPRQVPELAEYFEDLPMFRGATKYGSPVLEANIPFFERFLVDYGITTMVEYNGDIRPASFDYSFDIIYADIEVWSKSLSEMKKAQNAPIISISVYDSGKLLNWNLSTEIKETRSIQVDPKMLESRFCSSEVDLILNFLRYLRNRSPDIIVTFTDFDIPYVLSRADSFNVILSHFSPAKMEDFKRQRIYGIQTLDYRRLYCKVFDPPFSNLDYIARKELGYGKLECNVFTDWFRDPLKVIEYNLMDSLLLANLEKKLELITSFYKPIRDLTGLPFGMCMVNSKVGMNLHLRLGTKRKICFKTKSYAHPRSYEGAYVYAKTGLFNDVLQFDFSELYPSIMETFHISGDTKTTSKENVVTINGVSFRLDALGITNEVIKPLREIRREVKKKYKESREKKYEMLNMALKQVINSAYGIYGYIKVATKGQDTGFSYEYTVGSPLYDPEIAGAITYIGKEILLELIRYVTSLGYDVVYADTDSLFILSQEDPEKIRKTIEEHVSQYIMEKYKIESKLSISFEEKIKKLLVITKKRYAALSEDGNITFKGIEIVRRDTSNLMTSLLSRFITKAMNGASVSDLKDFILQEEKNIVSGKYPLQDLALRARCAKKNYKKVKPENKRAMEWAVSHGFEIEPGERFFKLYVKTPEGVIGYPSEKDLESVLKILEQKKIEIDYKKLGRISVKKLWNTIEHLSKETFKTYTLDNFFR